MSLALQEMLQALTLMKIELTINHNRSTMISVLERRRKYARLSLHHMFLEASNPVIIAIAQLLKNKSSKENNRVIRDYINEQSEKYDRYLMLNHKRLKTQGVFFDLKQLYQKINKQYFDNQLDLHITWFGNCKHPKSQISFGLYHPVYKLIKINRLLDRQNTPSFFIEYIIYHEMLHELCKPVISSKGYRKVHTKEFKEKEKLFACFDQAKAWEQQFKTRIFSRG